MIVTLQPTFPQSFATSWAMLLEGARHLVGTLLMHTFYLAKLDRRTFVLLGAASVMKNSDEIVEDRFAFFAREELLEQQCLLLQSELVVMGEELTASREKIATLVLMWTGIKEELRQAEAELRNARQQLDMSSTARS